MQEFLRKLFLKTETYIMLLMGNRKDCLYDPIDIQKSMQYNSVRYVTNVTYRVLLIRKGYVFLCHRKSKYHTMIL